MKHFQVPQDVTVRPLKAMLQDQPAAKGERWSFLKFATFIWLEDARPYTTSMADGTKSFSIVKQRRWIKVIAKFEDAKPGDWMSLDDEDYVALRAVVETPGRSFPAAVMIACMPFSEVVLEAVSELPAIVNGAPVHAVD
jgi:hypothetical protein